jgi:hypothetical protein
MSLIPPKTAIDLTLKVGSVYKFEAPELIDTKTPHYFIVIAIENENNFLSVCTSQLHSKINHLKISGIDLNTLAFIKPTDSNGFTKDTYVNCNDYHVITKTELINKVQSKSFHWTGRLSEDDYNKILKSISLSYTNDIPSFLLKY